jgi:transcriptional regulator with XRE-family HTH domain
MNDELVTYLTEEMERRGWSARELARRAGVSHTLISSTLAGTHTPGLKFCAGVARALDVAPETILRMAGKIPQRTTRKQLVDEILYYFDQMDEAEQLRLITIAFALSRNGNKKQPSPSSA